MTYVYIWYPVSIWLGPGILLGVALCCVAWTLFIGWRALRLTGYRDDASAEASDFSTDALSEDPGSDETGADSIAPLVSVVAYAPDMDGLDDFLDGMARQDMPHMEVIVVTDGGPETTTSLAERYAYHKGVYFTFLPAESRNVSRLKLAYTLGIKAARGEVVLTTATTVAVPSDRWVRLMSAPVLADPSTDIVLGYARTDPSPMGGVKWWREFDSLLTSAQWLGAALSDTPYRGDRRNLLFRRRLFFDHDGYSATNHLQTGDDDLFVSAIVRPGNTRVVLDPDTRVSESWGEATGRVWNHSRQRYSFTARWLRRVPFRTVAMAQAMQWIVLLLGFCGALWGWMGYDRWWPAAVAFGLLIVMWGVEIALYRKAAGRLGATRLWWSVVPFMMWRPVANTLFNLNHRRERVTNYTWQR